MNNLGNFSNSNGWDAVFQGLNAIGNVGKGVGSMIMGLKEGKSTDEDA